MMPSTSCAAGCWQWCLQAALTLIIQGSTTGLLLQVNMPLQQRKNYLTTLLESAEPVCNRVKCPMSRVKAIGFTELQVLGLTEPQRERQHFLQLVFRSMDGDLSAEIATARNTPHSLGGPDWFKV